MTMTNEDLCTVCGQNRSWHDHHSPRHKFDSPGDLMQEGETGKPEARQTDADGEGMTLIQARRALAGDPVVRLLLIECGVITAEQITAKEEQFATALLLGQNKVKIDYGSRNAQPHPGSRPRDSEDRGDRIASVAAGSLWDSRPDLGDQPTRVGSRAEEQVTKPL